MLINIVPIVGAKLTGIAFCPLNKNESPWFTGSSDFKFSGLDTGYEFKFAKFRTQYFPSCAIGCVVECKDSDICKWKQ